MPMYILGNKGLSKFRAICNAITAPINAEIIATIGIDVIPSFNISRMTCLNNKRGLSGFTNTFVINKKYLPIKLNF
jgi:hypothetical protein